LQGALSPIRTLREWRRRHGGYHLVSKHVQNYIPVRRRHSRGSFNLVEIVEIFRSISRQDADTGD
jgi:hypothetical protein